MTTDAPEDVLAQLLEDIKPGDIVTKGSDAGTANEIPPMVVHEVMAPNRVRLYDSETGEAYLAPKSIVGIRPANTTEGYKRGYGLLGQVTATGAWKWVEQDPQVSPRVRGNLKCRLHPDDPERYLWDEMGFPVCNKTGIPSAYEQERHLTSKHKTVATAIKARQEQVDRDAARDEARLLREALVAALGGQAPVVQREVQREEPKAVAPVEVKLDSEDEPVVTPAEPVSVRIERPAVTKFPSQMSKPELMAYCDAKGLAYNPADSKKAILRHVQLMRGIGR